MTTLRLDTGRETSALEEFYGMRAMTEEEVYGEGGFAGWAESVQARFRAIGVSSVWEDGQLVPASAEDAARLADYYRQGGEF